MCTFCTRVGTMSERKSRRRRQRAKRAATVASVVFAVACSPDSSEEAGGAPGMEAPPLAERSESEIARSQDPRPSVVLVVFDTLRADAVSAYGQVAGTTPNLDRLAREGLRYENAFAPAPWTVSSHATLFSGLRVDEHGVGLDGRAVVPDALPMLAEDFQTAGYATASFSENGLVGREFGFDQGFDRFETPDIAGNLEKIIRGEAVTEFPLLAGVRDWNRTRDPSQPYFLFVNLFDAHDPYEVRESNPWVPDGVPREELDYIASTYVVPQSLCDALPTRTHLDALRGLYLGDVARADAKFGELLEILEERDPETPRIILATSDHGEHLGENRLMGHQFSVRMAALHIPMVVSGIPESEPAVIEEAVELRSVSGSLRCWALGEGCQATLPIDALAEPRSIAESEPIIGVYSDSVARMPKWMLERFELTREQERAAPSVARARCGPDDRVFGEMVSMIRYPMKLTWFSRNEMVLHDLSWDPGERSDQIGRDSEETRAFRRELEAFVRRRVTERDEPEVPELSQEAARALESLGYIR